MARKRGNNEGSIFQLPDGRWRATLSLGYRNGKRWRKVLEAPTRQEVQRKLTAALGNQQRGMPMATQRQTVGQFLNSWLADVVKANVKPKTYRTYSDLCQLHLIPALGRRPLAQLSPQDVQAFLNEKMNYVACPRCRRRLRVTDFTEHRMTEHADMAGKTRGPALSARTVKHLLVTLRSALNMAVKWDLVPRNVAALVDAPRIVKPELKVFTPEQARAFIDAIKGERLEALFATALALGYRQGEALGLQWLDVDLKKGTLTVKQALQRVNGKLQLIPTKKDKVHTITLPAVTISALYAHRARQSDERLLAGTAWREHGHVFTTRVGTPIDARGVIRTFDRILNRAKLPKIRFHDLRHSVATLLLAQGVSPRYVSELLAHSSVSFTMQTYAHVLDQTKREVAAQTDAILGPVATSLATVAAVQRAS
jgi:integrase